MIKNVKLFFYRILSRCYWFYIKVIKESDPFMSFLYTIFAYTMFFVFYLWALLFYYDRKSGSHFLNGMDKLLPTAILTITISFIYFFKRRKTIEKMLKADVNRTFDKLDLLVIGYILLAFFTCFYNVYKSRI